MDIGGRGKTEVLKRIRSQRHFIRKPLSKLLIMRDIKH
jgi:hypothetical protein